LGRGSHHLRAHGDDPSRLPPRESPLCTDDVGGAPRIITHRTPAPTFPLSGGGSRPCPWRCPPLNPVPFFITCISRNASRAWHDRCMRREQGQRHSGRGGATQAAWRREATIAQKEERELNGSCVERANSITTVEASTLAQSIQKCHSISIRLFEERSIENCSSPHTIFLFSRASRSCELA